MGRDIDECARRQWQALFQSTRPVWGATYIVHADHLAAPISIHAPRMGRDAYIVHADHLAAPISIHAPRMGRDWRAGRLCKTGRISIHAPRMGRDYCPRRLRNDLCHFNPRAPYGARLIDYLYRVCLTLFQSTRPVWGATRYILCTAWMKSYFNPRAPYGARQAHRYVDARLFCISIHAPRMGRDASRISTQAGMRSFQSTRPVWGATAAISVAMRQLFNFNPRAPYGARRPEDRRACQLHGISIHAPRMGRDVFATVRMLVDTEFQSTRPVWGATVLVFARLVIF